MKGNFRAGEQFEIDGVWIRVVAGKKPALGGGHDLRFDVRTYDWVPITMPAVAALVEGIYDNEDVLYPRPRYQGGEKLMQFLRHSIRSGWQSARAGLVAEKAMRDRTPTLFGEDEVA